MEGKRLELIEFLIDFGNIILMIKVLSILNFGNIIIVYC